jgi:hypothetical protein
MAVFIRGERDSVKEVKVKSTQATVHLPTIESNHAPHLSMGNHQIVIISQLLQIIENVKNIDELFLWLVHILSRRLGIDVIQFWTLQNHVEEQATLDLRTMVSRNLELPQHIVNNLDVVGEIRHVLKERSGLMPVPVATVFSQDQVNLLTRHNLHYWACYFLCNSSLLPPAMGKHDSKDVYTPLVMVASLFMRQPPSPRVLPTIGHILEQTMLIAKKRGLLLTDVKQQQLPLLVPPPTLQGNAQQTGSKSTLLDLIPSRIQTGNPLAETLLLTDQPAYQLYHAIDGHKSLAELASFTRFKAAEFHRALRSLLNRKHIRFYERGGHQVENELVLQSL